MKIAIASGKGGTGKTTIATALARIAAKGSAPTTYVDCDVEAPNGHLLLRLQLERCEVVTRLVPQIDATVCDGCRRCEAACRFGAIVCLPSGVQVYPQLCKSCGACVNACPTRAIVETPVRVGEVAVGRSSNLRFLQGQLDVGQPRAVPVIEAALRAAAAQSDLLIIDAPPGASCPMVAATRGADLVVLVTDATPFGLADLRLVTDATLQLGRPLATVINRCNVGDQRVWDFCKRKGIPVLAEIPHSRSLAESYSVGDMQGILAELDETMRQVLRQLRRWEQRRAS